jgi:hypothetical protein
MLRKHSLIMCGVVLLGVAAAQAQSKLERRFAAGETWRYRVQLTVRSELQGQRAAEGADGKAYAQPFTESVEMSVAWTARRRVLAVVPTDGSADIEEALEEFSEIDVRSGSALDMETREVRDALRNALEHWRSAERHLLNYHETKLGQLTGVPLDESPRLDDWPLLLTPWLLRAARPTAALPNREFRMGAQWEEPRAVNLADWREVTGTESGQWLAGPTATATDPPSVRLHVVQQISGDVAGPKRPDGSADKIGEGRFHAESLSTLVQAGVADPKFAPGLLLAATRSASRETTRVLEPVAGMPEPPRFRARISVQVEITLLK